MAARAALAAALLCATLACSCASRTTVSAPPAPAAAEPSLPPSARPSGRIAFRPHLKFSDGRGSYAGISFVLDSQRPLAIIPSHVVLGLLRDSKLQAVELTDAQTKARLATASGLALPAGPPMNGYDFSTDFAIVALSEVPDGAARIGLAPQRPKIGDAVEVVACPADASAPEVVIQGTVSYATSTRLELNIDPPGVTRGFSGAAILDRSTGLAVGVVQTVVVTTGAGKALVRATPAEAIAPKLAEAGAGTTTTPFTTWRNEK